MTDGYFRTQRVLIDVAAERERQDERYGSNDDLEEGAGPECRWLGPYTWNSATDIELVLRHDYEEYEEDAGKPTWVHLVREEIAEAFAEEDPEKRRAELVQVAALCVKWVEKIDAREEVCKTSM